MKINILLLRHIKYYVLFSKMGLPGSSEGKESACTVGDHGLIPRLGRSPGGGKKELSVNAATKHLNSYSVDSFSHY